MERLGEYPYTYVRSNVMKSLLLKKEDYHKLMKMSLPEITRFLQESAYKKEIDQLAARFKGIDLLEIAINKNLVNSFNKLKRISPPELRLVLFVYLKRMDIDNIKKILRGKYAHWDEAKIHQALLPAGILSMEALESLMKKDSIEGVLQSMKMFDYRLIEPSVNRFRQEGTLIEIESALDRLYFDEVMEFSQTLPTQGEFLREFLMLEMEVRDIMTIFMLRRENIEMAKIRHYLITERREEKNKIVHALSRMRDLETMTSYLETTRYGKFLDEGIKRLREENTLLYFEKEIMVSMLKVTTTFTHQNPLSIQNILDYLFGKQNECENLKRIIKGKQLGVDDAFVESMIII